MMAIEFVKKLEALEKAVFTLNDVSRIIGKKGDYSKLYLHRLKKKNFIIQLEKGKYMLKKHPYIIASNLAFPSYISLITALSYYNFTTQLPNIIYIISTSSKKNIEIDNYRIKFIKFKHFRFFGYHKERYEGKFIFIAEPEKAIIDSLYMPEYCPIDEVFSAVKTGDFDDKKLVDYAVKMKSKVLIKRLGYMLDLSNIDVYDKFKSIINKRYDLLNPNLPKNKKKSKKWRLIINEVLG